MALVRFNRDWQQFRNGQVVELGNGVADCYVNYSRVAEYVKVEEESAEPASATTSKPEKPIQRTTRLQGPREGHHGRNSD